MIKYKGVWYNLVTRQCCTLFISVRVRVSPLENYVSFINNIINILFYYIFYKEDNLYNIKVIREVIIKIYILFLYKLKLKRLLDLIRKY